MHDSIWTEDRDWMMSVLHQERSYSVVWERSGGYIPDDLETVYLGAQAISDYGVQLLLSTPRRS